MSQSQKSPERPADMVKCVDQLISSVSASLRSGQSSGRIEDVLANLESTDESFYSYVIVGVNFLASVCSKKLMGTIPRTICVAIVTGRKQQHNILDYIVTISNIKTIPETN